MSSPPAGRAPITCPICEAPVAVDGAAFPFCSKRCRLLDLDKWITGAYRVTRPMDARDVEDLEAAIDGRAPSTEVLANGDDDDDDENDAEA